MKYWPVESKQITSMKIINYSQRMFALISNVTIYREIIITRKQTICIHFNTNLIFLNFIRDNNEII